MNGKRVLRYVGNREQPEKELFGKEEILHGWDKFLILPEFRDLAIPIQGLSDIKPLTFYGKSKMTQLVEPVSLPNSEPSLSQVYAHISGAGSWPFASPFMYEEKEEPKPPEPEFEVNMVEPLVGWRSWHLHEGLLRSLDSGKRWFPGEALEAAHGGLRHHTDVPRENCSCGIYAVDHAKEVPGGTIYGEVYGWGRYVRGNNGWRSQYAYPKCFYLDGNQAPLMEQLRKYHVPIYMMTPVQCYSPKEDGYDEYRPNEADGNFGAAQEPGSGEET